MQQNKISSPISFGFGLKRKRQTEQQDDGNEKENVLPPTKFKNFKLEWTEIFLVQLNPFKSQHVGLATAFDSKKQERVWIAQLRNRLGFDSSSKGIILSLEEMYHLANNLKASKEMTSYETEWVKLEGKPSKSCYVLTRQKREGSNTFSLPFSTVNHFCSYLRAMLDYIEFYKLYQDKETDWTHIFKACARFVQERRSNKDSLPLKKDRLNLDRIFDLQSRVLHYVDRPLSDEECERWEHLADSLTPEFTKMLENAQVPAIEKKIENMIERLMLNQIYKITLN